jgi:hypothetical protein
MSAARTYALKRSWERRSRSALDFFDVDARIGNRVITGANLPLEAAFEQEPQARMKIFR